MKRIILRILVVFLFLVGVASGQKDLQKTPEIEILEKEPVAKRTFTEETEELDLGALEETGITIKSQDLLDFDDKSQLIYGRTRTSIHYQQYLLEADKVILDIRLKEIQAEGNVILTYKGEKIQATSLKYNLQTHEGEGYGVSGRRGAFYFKSSAALKEFKDAFSGKKAITPAREETPAFYQVSKDEVNLNYVSFTACEFPIPHYRLKAKEIIIYLNERVFMRHIYIYVREIPVMYLPFYTRSLREGSPWSVTFGYSGRLGGYLRLGYEYQHYIQEPSTENENRYITRSEGKIGATVDYYSKRGIGGSLRYRYNLLYGRHLGEIYFFGINDTNRDVEGEKEEFRWVMKAQLWSQIFKDLYFQADIDEFSDSEIYYDFLDRFLGEEYGRRAERGMKSAVTFRQDYYVARIMAEIRDRISRNRITNFSEPGDNDRDFDERFDTTQWHHEGLPSSRFGRVTERAPHLQFASNKIPLIRGIPLYYNFYLDVINNLDKGLNVNSMKDDAYVRGVDFYQTLTHRIKLSDKLTWLNTIGVGNAIFDRQYDSWHYDYPSIKNDNGTPTDPHDDYWLIDSTKFTDQDEILIGRRKVSLRDYENEYFYGDFTSRLSMRFSESLKGYLKYTYRDGTDNSLGEIYESLGSVYTRNDLYNFRLKKHWIEAYLNYTLLYPDLSFDIAGGQNLQSEKDIYANEQLNYARSSINYTTQDKTLKISPYTMFSTTQMRDPTDPNEYSQRAINTGASLSYNPLSKKWWFTTRAYWYKILDDDPIHMLGDHNHQHFNEGESKYVVDAKVGRKLGPKYTVEIGGRYDSRAKDITRAHISIARDLHDLIVQLLVGYRSDPYSYDEDNGKRNREWEVRVAFQPKTPDEKERILKREFSVITVTGESKSESAAVEE